MRVLNLNRLLLAQLIIFASLIASTAAQNVPMAKPNCPETCGNITIPYPFGIGHRNCYLNPWFEITCSNNSSIPRPFLRRFNLEILSIALSNGAMIVNNPVYSTCRDGSSYGTALIFRNTPFNFSCSNIFMTIGCENALMMDQREEVFEGCTSTSIGLSPSSHGCYGINCCQTTIPFDLDFYSLSSTVNTSACTCAFLASPWFQTNLSSIPLLVKSQDHVPVLLS